jgi:enoyl-CoA hydratase/carnithine racemase
MISLERHDGVVVIHLGDGDNRFDGDTVPALHAALDEIEAACSDGPLALVTAATGKVWHNGLDLDHMATLADWTPFVDGVEGVFARLLQLPAMSVAAIQGHVFAGGAMLALAHDVRVMRADRGYFCLPEIDLGIPFRPGMAALIAAKVPQPALHRLAVLGERFGGDTAVAAGIVDLVADEARVLEVAIARARELAVKAKPAAARIRANFYGDVIATLGSAG